MKRVAMLLDQTKCIGCRSCQVACKSWNDLPAAKTTNRGTYENPADLTYSTWTRIRFLETKSGGRVRWRFLKEQCLHCGEAPCVRVCPSRALSVHDRGFVDYDRTKCVACGTCTRFCPFDVPRKRESAGFGKKVLSKCTMCRGRVTNGEIPACAKSCPSGAIRFGDRAELIRGAEDRAARLRRDGAPEAAVYGTDIVGGLGVLYLLASGPAASGLPARPRVSRAVDVWSLLKPLFPGALGIALLGAVAHLLVHKVEDPNLLEEVEDEEGAS